MKEACRTFVPEAQLEKRSFSREFEKPNSQRASSFTENQNARYPMRRSNFKKALSERL